MTPRSLIPKNVSTPPRRVKRNEVHAPRASRVKEVPGPEENPNVKDEEVPEPAVKDEVLEPAVKDEPAAKETDPNVKDEEVPEPAKDEEVPEPAKDEVPESAKDEVPESAVVETVESGDEDVIDVQLEHTKRIAELRAMCLKKGLSASGRKADLVQRLIEHREG